MKKLNITSGFSEIVKKLILCSFLLILISSCSDEFLNITNENELNSENYYSKVENFNMALTAVYSSVKSIDLFGQAFYIQTLLALPHESDYWNAQSRNEVTSPDGNVYLAWRGWYRVIARANDIIENTAPYIEKYDPVEADVERLDKILGQAYFFRAFSYFHLVRLWGESSYKNNMNSLSVPLILEVASNREEMMQPRATVGEVYTQIISDFQNAELMLPEIWDASNIARVNNFTS
jgi:hypothetical protein